MAADTVASGLTSEFREMAADVTASFKLNAGIQAQRLTDRVGIGDIQRSKFTGRRWSNDKPWDAEPSIPVRTAFRENANDLTSRIKTHLAQTLEFPQDKCLKDAIDMVAQTPTGAALLESAQQGQVEFFNDTQLTSLGAYMTNSHTIAANPRFIANKESPETFTASLFNVVSHELFHAWQDKNGVLRNTFNVEFDIDDSVMMTNHLEAAAYAMEAQIAWEAKEMSNIGPWYCSDLSHSRMFQAFAKTARENPESVANGEARRAAHDAYFESGIRTGYDLKTIACYRDTLDILKSEVQPSEMHDKFSTRRVTRAEIAKMAIGPDGSSPLELPGKPDPLDRQYRDIPHMMTRGNLAITRKNVSTFKESNADMAKNDSIGGSMFTPSGGGDAKSAPTMKVSAPALTPSPPRMAR